MEWSSTEYDQEVEVRSNEEERRLASEKLLLEYLAAFNKGKEDAEKIKTLEAQLNEMSVALVSAEERARICAEEKAVLQQQLMQMTSNFEAEARLRLALSEMQEKTDRDLSELRPRFNDLLDVAIQKSFPLLTYKERSKKQQSELKQLRAELDETRDRSAKYQELSQKQEAELAHLKKQLEAASFAHDQQTRDAQHCHNNQIEGLEDELVTAQLLNSVLEMENKGCEEAKAAMEQDMKKQLEDAIAVHDKQITDANQQIADLAEQLAKAKQLKSVLVKDSKDCKKANGALKHQIKILMMSIDIEGRKQQLDNNIKSCEEGKAALDNEIEIPLNKLKMD